MALHASRNTQSQRGADNRIDRLRIRHLRLLELVDRTGSLTAAAQTLHISQPGATKMLHELEAAFQTTLVDRTTRGGVLSRSGRHALERLRIALGAVQAAGEAAAGKAALPLVRVGMLPLAGVALIPRLVAILARDGDLPRLQLVEGAVSSVLAQLRAGEIDCVIGRIDVDSARHGLNDMDIRALHNERLAVACALGHTLARRRRLTMRQLQDYQWILPTQATYTRQAFEAAFLGQGLAPPEPLIESTAFHTNLATVAQTELLTIAPQSAVAYYQALGKVRSLALATPFPTDFLVFATLKATAGMSSVERIASVLQRIARPLP